MLALASHVECQPRAALRLGKKMGPIDRQTDGRTDGQTPYRYIMLIVRHG